MVAPQIVPIRGGAGKNLRAVMRTNQLKSLSSLRQTGNLQMP
jgi:hypothetical protein